MQIARNLGRHKVRSLLTVSGIVIGVFALTTMGAMAEHFNALLDGGVTYFSSAIQVRADSESGQSLLPVSAVGDIERIPGVVAAFPGISVAAEPGSINTVSFNVPDTIYAQDPGSERYSSFKITYASGHEVSAASRGQVVLGSSIATELKRKVGDVVDLPVRPSNAKADFVNHPFTVVGVLGPTQTAPDTGAYVNLADGQMLLQDSLPVAIRDQVDVSTLVEGITVFGAPGASLSQLDGIADRINSQVPGVQATRPSELVDGFRAGGAVFTAITTGAALLALVIGGLSVVNTMLMAVTERIREIGLKKAVGAHTHHVLVEFLSEAVLIGALGGVTGYLLGVALTNIVNYAGRSSGIELFLVDGKLTVVALGFALGLGAIAGVMPALRAARLDPVVALRTVT